MKVSEISDPSKTVLEISNMIKKKKKKTIEIHRSQSQKESVFPFCLKWLIIYIHVQHFNLQD